MSVIALAAGCAFPAGHQDGPAPVPSEAEARSHFAQVVGLAMGGDFGGLCDLGDSNCRNILRDASEETVPPLPPRIVGTRVVEPEIHGDTWSTGGFVLQVCGIDGHGKPYFDEVLVFNDGTRLISTGTIYWSRTRIAEGPTAGGPQPTPPPECPA
jgi:hypothetical protein